MADLDLTAWLITLFQVIAFVAAAPLFASWVRRVKATLQNRKAPRWLQPYRDLRKLFAKEVLLPKSASAVFRMSPYIVVGAMVIVVSFVPLLSAELPNSRMADAIVLVGLFALSRFFLALAGMDIGTSFGGMGSSREMMIASLAEPAMLMVVFTLAMVASSTNLSTVVQHTLTSEIALRPSLLFAFVALLMVAIAETGRIPIDNPDTHLELTMIHEAMILEYTGRHLAMMELAAQIKLLIYAVLLINLFLPWGIAMVPALSWDLASAAAVLVGKLAVLGVALALGETAVAKMRLFRAPTYLAVAYSAAFVGMLSFVILEAR